MIYFSVKTYKTYVIETNKALRFMCDQLGAK